MALRVLLLVCLQAVHAGVLAQDTASPVATERPSVPGQNYIDNAVNGGFRVTPEFDRVDRLEEQGMIDAALETLTELTERESDSFPSSRRERFMKGVALYKRGLIRAEHQGSADALDDFRKSAELGCRESNYQAAAHLLLRIKSGQSPDVASDRDEAFKYYLAGAELGNPVCIDMVQLPLRAMRDAKHEHYWFLLERMGEERDKVLQFETFYNETFTDEDRTFLRQAMAEQSLSGGKVSSQVNGLPGRSVLTAGYVDLYLRKQLNFVWLAFFDRDAPDMPLREIYAGSRHLLREQSPVIDLWMLVNKRYAADDAKFQMSAEELAQNLLAGDQIVVRCGRLSHVATVWDIDRSKGTARILDPFAEYWLPEQNRCVTVRKLVPYRHGRTLTEVSLDELQKMLVAILTIRDAPQPDAPTDPAE